MKAPFNEISDPEFVAKMVLGLRLLGKRIIEDETGIYYLRKPNWFQRTLLRHEPELVLIWQKNIRSGPCPTGGALATGWPTGSGSAPGNNIKDIRNSLPTGPIDDNSYSNNPPGPAPPGYFTSPEYIKKFGKYL